MPMARNFKLIKDVWSQQPEGYYFLTEKTASGEWNEHPFKTIKEAITWLKKQPKHNDYYWCPTTFFKPERKKKYVNESHFLWSDLDHANPQGFEQALQPSIVWQSSPNRYQALWKLNRLTTPEHIEEVNKRIAYHFAPQGADKGGWDLSQVLRIPGTLNNKYDAKPKVRIVWKLPDLFALDKLREILPEVHIHEKAKANFETDLTFDQVWKLRRKDIPRWVRKLLLQKKVEPGKRSEVLHKIENELAEQGFSEAEIFALVANSGWNKFKDRPQQLMNEIAEAVASVDRKDPEMIKEKKRKTKKENELFGDGSFKVDSYFQLMGNIRSQPGWLVPGFWSKRSHGIIAGEPKSFKTTLLLDFALSVSSGTPFLGKYMPEETGTILFFQNENAPWILKDRMQKMIQAKGLGGKAHYSHRQNLLKVSWPQDLPFRFVNQQGVMLDDEEHQQGIMELIEQEKPILTIFDPLYLMFGGDVNSAKELNGVLQFLLKLKNDFNTGIALVHHYNKSGTSRRGGQRMLGSTTLHGWIESAWYLTVNGTQEDDSDDEDPQDENSGQAFASLTMEREFRGAGLYPKIDLLLKMTEDDDGYAVAVSKHEENKQGKAVDRDNLREQVLNHMRMKQEPFSQRRLSEETGVSRRVIKPLMDLLEKEGVVEKHGKSGYIISETVK